MKNIVLLLTVSLGLVACENDGPAERLGEEIDRAAGQLGDAAQDAGNAVEDLCEDATSQNC